MTEYAKSPYMFGWQEFPEGRVRFNGDVRGSDEAGHDTIAVDLDGEISYGEIALESADGGQRYGLTVRSMGFKYPDSVGAPMDDASGMRTYSSADAERIQRLIALLVAEFVEREKRPAFFFSPKTAFTGSLKFAPGWCFITDKTTSG